MTENDVEIPYALDNKGNLTHASEPHLPHGMACDCTCLDCEQPLLAKKGKIRAHHFAHPPATDGARRACQPSGLKTPLRLMARTLLAQMTRIELPEQAVSYNEGLRAMRAPAMLFTIEHSGLNVVGEGIRFDAVLSGGGRKVHVKLAVNEQMSETVADELSRTGIEALEINLLGFMDNPDHVNAEREGIVYDNLISEIALRNELYRNPQARWLAYPGRAEDKDALVAKFEADVQQRAREEEERQRLRGIRFAERRAALQRDKAVAPERPPPAPPEGRSTTGPSSGISGVGLDGYQDDTATALAAMPVTGPDPASALRAKKAEAMRDHIEVFITSLRRNRP